MAFSDISFIVGKLYGSAPALLHFSAFFAFLALLIYDLFPLIITFQRDNCDLYIIPALGKLRQEDSSEFWASLGYRVRPYLNKKNGITKELSILEGFSLENCSVYSQGVFSVLFSGTLASRGLCYVCSSLGFYRA